jgi:hypothetical protein
MVRLGGSIVSPMCRETYRHVSVTYDATFADYEGIVDIRFEVQSSDSFPMLFLTNFCKIVHSLDDVYSILFVQECKGIAWRIVPHIGDKISLQCHFPEPVLLFLLLVHRLLRNIISWFNYSRFSPKLTTNPQ